MHLDEGEPSELLPMMEARELDVAIVYRYGMVPGRMPRSLRHETLLVEDLLLLSPLDHQLVRPTASISVDGLDQEKWVTTRPGTAGASLLRRLCALAGFEPEITYRSNNYATIHGLVAAGLGIAIVPALGYTGQPGVLATPLEGDGAYREVSAIRSPATAEGSWRTIIAALHAAAGELTRTAPGFSRSRR